jgi:tripartite-type tricarboxylate transporter receptor subunit TctC
MSVNPPRLFLATLSLLSSMILSAVADDARYPRRPITMVVTFAAGGSSDLLARTVAGALSAGIGQQVVVANRPGAGGHIGAEAVARAAPDGYTILFGTNGTLGIGPALYKNLHYDPERDLAPVGLLHKLPLLLIVNPSVPATNLAELIDYARRNPGTLTFASAGVGSASHLAGELLKEEANIDILHLPYKGGGAAVPDLVSGRVSMMIETIPNALPLVRGGQMRAIGVTTSKRSTLAPDIRSLAESGLPDFDTSAWTGLFVPSGTSPAIVDRLNSETRKLAGDKDYVARIQAMGTDVSSSSPQAFGVFVSDDIRRWSAVVRHAGIPQIE